MSHISGTPHQFSVIFIQLFDKILHSRSPTGRKVLIGPVSCTCQPPCLLTCLHTCLHISPELGKSWEISFACKAASHTSAAVALPSLVAGNQIRALHVLGECSPPTVSPAPLIDTPSDSSLPVTSVYQVGPKSVPGLQSTLQLSFNSLKQSQCCLEHHVTTIPSLGSISNLLSALGQVGKWGSPQKFALCGSIPWSITKVLEVTVKEILNMMLVPIKLKNKMSNFP